jgi:SAM-dependent methyltransferase
MGEPMQVAERIQWAIDQLVVPPGSRVLEVGCGHGQALGLLADRASPGFVLGIDRSSAMVSAARRRHQPAIDAGQIEVRQVALESGLSGDETFDIVVGINVPLFSACDHPGWSVIRSRIAPAGRLGLFLQPPTVGRLEHLSAALMRNVLANGFAVEHEVFHEFQPAPMIGIIAFRPGVNR